jgi:tetratricopeptide (TPR) repeat protein
MMRFLMSDSDRRELLATRRSRTVPAIFPGMIIRGLVTSVQRPQGLLVRLTKLLYLDGHPLPAEARDSEGLFSLGLHMLCPPSELADNVSPSYGSELLLRFVIGDIVNAIIIDTATTTYGGQTVFGTISLKNARRPQDAAGACSRLGLEKAPTNSDHSLSSCYLVDGGYNSQLVGHSEFSNLTQVSGLLPALQIQAGKGFQSMLPQRPLAQAAANWLEIRRKQNSDFANESVSRGVAAAKAGDYELAHKCYLKALEADPGNADAMVARGAAFANQKKFEEASALFRDALKLQPRHANALKYQDAIQQKLEEERLSRKYGLDKRADEKPASSSGQSHGARSKSLAAAAGQAVRPPSPTLLSSTSEEGSSDSSSSSSGEALRRKKRKERKKQKREKKEHRKKEKKERKDKKRRLGDSTSSAGVVPESAVALLQSSK